MSRDIQNLARYGAHVLGRRSFIAKGTLSGASIALLAGSGTALAYGTPKEGDVRNDIEILNSALAAEHEAVAAYQVGAESGLLKSDVLKLAVQFQSHHKAHVEVLAGTVRQLGGTAVDAKSRYAFPVETLKRQDDVLQFAAGLEQGAVSAYLNAVPLFGSGDLAKAAASILGDEAMHWAVLRHALGQDPVPFAFVS